MPNLNNHRHALLAHPNDAPQPMKGGRLSQALRVAHNPAQTLDPMSRIDYGEIHIMEHNLKVHDMRRADCQIFNCSTLPCHQASVALSI
jgi:hypothetical protein